MYPLLSEPPPPHHPPTTPPQTPQHAHKKTPRDKHKNLTPEIWWSVAIFCIETLLNTWTMCWSVEWFSFLVACFVSMCIYIIRYVRVEVVICFVLCSPFHLIICLIILARSHFLSSYVWSHCTSFMWIDCDLWFISATLSETKLTFCSLVFEHLKDAIDLLQGHYIVSVGRDMTTPSQKGGGLEAVAVSTSQMPIIFFWGHKF